MGKRGLPARSRWAGFDFIGRGFAGREWTGCVPAAEAREEDQGDSDHSAGGGEPERRENARLDLGAMDYISKPFDEAELRARVWAALQASFFLSLLSKKAMIDGVSGLWNRPYFDQRMTAEISLARRSGRPYFVF